MADVIDNAAELEQRQRDAALSAARTRQVEQPKQTAQGRCCIDCDELIPAGRLKALPQVVRCIDCQSMNEIKDKQHHG